MLTFTDTYTYTPRYQELDFWQEDQLLFDIETTGLSAKYNTIYYLTAIPCRDTRRGI